MVASQVYNSFIIMDVNIKLLVCFEYESFEKLEELLSFFVKVRLFNVVYVAFFEGQTMFEIFNYIVFRNKLNVFKRYESVKQAYPEQNDFVGLSITACTTEIGMYSYLDPITREVEGFDLQFVLLILEKMHANVTIEFVECDPNENDDSCLKRQIGQYSCKLNFG